MLLVFPLIVEQGTTITAAMPGYYQGLRAWMIGYPNQLIVRLSEFLPATLAGLELNQQTGQQMRRILPGKRRVMLPRRLR